MNKNLGTEDSQQKDILELVLQHQLENTRLFLGLLEREQALLASGELESLSKLIADKEQIVSQLAQLDVQINQLLATAGFSKGIQGIKNWIAANQSDATIAHKWEELLSLTRRAQQLNQTNASIVSTRLRHAQQTLGALRDMTGHTALYNPKGQIT